MPPRAVVQAGQSLPCSAADAGAAAIKTASSAPDGSLQTIRSRLRSHSPVITTWTPAEIRNAGAALLRAGLGLFGAVQQVVSPEMMVIGDRLGWEDHWRKQQGAP